MQPSQKDLIHLHAHLTDFYDFMGMSGIAKHSTNMMSAIETVLTGIETASKELPRDAVTVPVRDEDETEPTARQLQLAVLASAQAVARVVPEGAAFSIIFIDKKKPDRIAFSTSWDLDKTAGAITQLFKAQNLL